MKLLFRNRIATIVMGVMGVLFCFGVSARADQPKPWEIGFQDAASPVMEQLAVFHHGLLYMVYGVSAFVMALLAYVVIRFRAKRNPVPSKTTHHTGLEVIWTIIPVLIVIAIAIPSMRLLYNVDRVPQADMTLKVIGSQWYWSYQYPDQGNIAFDSNIVPDNELKPGQVRLLSVDHPVVLPVDTTVRVQVTAADVIHSWAVPSLGVKKDAVPGRLNETWLRITKPGVYYGQCSELCGTNHGFMPIEIRAVSKEEFAEWVKNHTR